MILHATVTINEFPPESLVTLGEDLAWWSEYPALARYMQILSPVLVITPYQPSRVLDMYRAVKELEPTLTLVEVDEADPPSHIRGRIY